MKPKVLHDKAMQFSFLAKQAREAGKEDDALSHYEEAAKLESEAAEYYFDKPDLEPTRSILIRSAAFLNIKAGFVEKAEKFIFWGIVNSQDLQVKDQLYEILELCIAQRTFSKGQISENIEYIYKLRKKSIFYILEPKDHFYSRAVTLDMISDFSDNYTKSLKAYSKSKFRAHFANDYKDSVKEQRAADEFQKKINPLVSNAAFGSFKFSVAVDFLPRLGESKELVTLKSNILLNYHDEIFVTDFTDLHIAKYKKQFDSEEIDEIFRPVLNMRSTKSLYDIGYYDRENLSKQYVSPAKNSHKSKLLPVRKISKDDIGYLENVLLHTHEVEGSTATRKVILKKQLKNFEFDFPTKIIEPKDFGGIILNWEIILSVKFDSTEGFTISFDDLYIEASDINFTEALSRFYLAFRNKILYLTSQESLPDNQLKYLDVVKKLINNPGDLK